MGEGGVAVEGGPQGSRLTAKNFAAWRCAAWHYAALHGTTRHRRGRELGQETLAAQHGTTAGDLAPRGPTAPQHHGTAR